MLQSIPEEERIISPSISKTKPTPNKTHDTSTINLDLVDDYNNRDNREERVSKTKPTPEERDKNVWELKKEETSSKDKGQDRKERKSEGKKNKSGKLRLRKASTSVSESKYVRSKKPHFKEDKEAQQQPDNKRKKENFYQKEEKRDEKKFLGMKRNSLGRMNTRNSVGKDRTYPPKKREFNSDRPRNNFNKKGNFDTPKQGWLCETCHQINFSNRVDCFKCHSPIPLNPEYADLPPKPKRNDNNFNNFKDGRKNYGDRNNFKKMRPDFDNFRMKSSSRSRLRSSFQKNLPNKNSRENSVNNRSFNSQNKFQILPSTKPIISEFSHAEIEKAILFLKTLKSEDKQSYYNFKNTSH